jgi:hypothetical protein
MSIWTTFKPKDELPAEGEHVLVQYVALGGSILVHGAKRFKAFDHMDHLFWFNDKGEAMRGVVTSWTPMATILEL